jgi:hypothetical protein
MIAEARAVEVQLRKAQPGVVDDGAPDLLVQVELLAKQAGRQTVFGGEAGGAPRGHSVSTQILGDGPGCVEMVGQVPTGLHLGRRPPVVAGLNDERIPGGELHPNGGNQPGRTVAAVVHGADRDDVFAWMDKIGDIGDGRQGGPGPGCYRRAVDENVSRVFGPGDADSTGDLAARRDGERASEKAIAGGSLDLGLGRVPNPMRALEQDVRASGVLDDAGLVAADPFAVPVGSLQEAHGPLRGSAPVARLAVLVPDLHLPEGHHSGGEGLAGIDHVNRLARIHLAGIPEVAVVDRKGVFCRGNEHAIGLLA